MFTAGRPGKAGHSQIIVAIKVIVVWFFLARAILVVGVANGIPETTLWTLDIAFFALTALYVLVRESVNDGLSPKLLAFASLLTIGGAGIFTSLPRNLHLKDVVQQPLPGIGSVQSFIDGSDDKTFIDMTPVEHLARASKLIFDHPTVDSLSLARRHILGIPATAREFPSGQALMKAADASLHQINFQNSRTVRNSGGAGQPIEVLGTDRTESGWSITLRNTTGTRIGNIKYEMDCFSADGWKIDLKTPLPPIDKVMNSHETMTLDIGFDVVPRDAFHASFNIVSSEVVGKSR